jgi:hypothetical protein
MLFPAFEFFLLDRQVRKVDALRARRYGTGVESANQTTGSAGPCLPQNDISLACCDPKDNTSLAARPRRHISRQDE